MAAAAPGPRVAEAVERRGLFAKSAGEVLVVAAGKAAAAMASALPPQAAGMAILAGGAERPSLPCGIELLQADHPVPSRRGFAASRRVLAAVEGLGADATLLCLLSGGCSSLFEVPADGLDEDEVIAVYRLLLSSGAPIQEINTVRSTLSAVKGGGLARAARPAASITLAVSDVAGDDPVTIGSGPTVPRHDAPSDAVAVLRRWRLWDDCPPALRRWLEESESRAKASATAGEFEVVVGEGAAAEGAKRWLAAAGYRPEAAPIERLYGSTTAVAEVLADAIRGLARSAGRRALALHGETTVRLPSDAGVGGRNQHLAAELALLLAGEAGFACLVGGTDGIDGSSDAAGALIDGATADRAVASASDLAGALEAFATTAALQAAGDVVRTGPTDTNLGDLLVVVGGREQ